MEITARLSHKPACHSDCGLLILKIFGMLPKQLITTVIVNHHNEILMMLRDNKPGIANPGKWAFIGGHMEKSESPVEAARREIWEETGIAIATKDLKRLTVIKNYEYTKYVFCVMGRWNNADVIVNEGQDMRFMTLNQVQRLMTSEEHQQILDIFLKLRRSPGGALLKKSEPILRKNHY